MSRSYVGAQLDAESRQVCDLARELAQEELRPRAAERDAREDDFDRETLDRLAELGFLGLLAPPEMDGLGLDLVTYLCVIEELAWGDPSVALSVSVHNSLPTQILLRHGSSEQQERWLAPMARGEMLGAFALSEAGAGSDAAGLTTRAVRDGDAWVLRGEKLWVTHGVSADLTMVFARTDPETARGNPDGIGAFVVPTDAPGYRPGKQEHKMGLRGSETVAVTLDDVHLGADHVVGDPGQGYRYALAALGGGRLGIASQAAGIAQAALDLAMAYAAERQQFGEAIGRRQGLRFKLAEMGTHVAAGRSLRHVAARLQAREDPAARRYSSMAKVRASEAAVRVTRDAVQVFGGYGYMREYPVERLFRDAKVTEIYEGTNEIHRSIIANRLFTERGLDP